jgi:hypothetical protein
MSENCAGNGGDGSLPFAGGGGAARYLTNGLRLAAAPTFSAMALLAGLPGGGAASDLLCLTADHGSPFSGMVPMYLLMSAFHLPPWLNLLSGRENGAKGG